MYVLIEVASNFDRIINSNLPLLIEPERCIVGLKGEIMINMKN